MDYKYQIQNTQNNLLNLHQDNLIKVTLYDNTLKRYYHNNLFVYCLTLDLNICYICRNFVNLNNKDNLTYFVNKVINKKNTTARVPN